MDWWVWLILGIIAFIIIGRYKDTQHKKQTNNALRQRRQQAEEYILNSGDQEAIKTLMLARAVPEQYGKVLAGGMNKGNDTLKTALGVMTGVVAGTLIANALSATLIEDALGDMQADLDALDQEDAGGKNDFDDGDDSGGFDDGGYDSGFDDGGDGD
jgi:hypothetical protein